MKMKGLKLFEKLLERHDRVSLIALSNLMKLVIPFNAPHSFRFTRMSAQEVEITLPHHKLNHNHLGGMHACAIATLGEFCAGMTLVKVLGFSRYRLILAQLNVQYHLQGRTTLRGIARLDETKAQELKNKLQAEEKVLFEHETEILNTYGEKVATVTSTWQIKEWEKVQLK